MGDWSQLPLDLLDQITNRLTLPDMIRFGCVCKPWRSASIPSHHKGHLPWLIIPLQQNSKEKGNIWTNPLTFFSILNNISYNTHIPELLDRRICGSSNGWLITIHQNGDIHLLHPFTRKLIELPSFFEFPGIHRLYFFNDELYYLISNPTTPNPTYAYLDTASLVRDHYIKKAILSPSFVVMGIIGPQSCLFFCEPHDTKWQVIGDGEYYSDVIHYKAQFYAIQKSGAVVVIDGLGLDHGGTFAPRILVQEGECDSGESGPSYLVESSGDLLKVVQSQVLSTEGDGGVSQFYKKLAFKVWKLDFGRNKWLEVKHLGDRALFLGSNHSCSVSVTDFPGCKGNCIYFTGGLWEMYDGSYDLGMYNLEDSSFDILHRDASPSTLPQPIWYASMSM